MAIRHMHTDYKSVRRLFTIIIMQTHNSYRENSTGSLNDCLEVIKHSRSTGEAVSLQTITKKVVGDESE